MRAYTAEIWCVNPKGYPEGHFISSWLGGVGPRRGRLGVIEDRIFWVWRANLA